MYTVLVNATGMTFFIFFSYRRIAELGSNPCLDPPDSLSHLRLNDFPDFPSFPITTTTTHQKQLQNNHGNSMRPLPAFPSSNSASASASNSNSSSFPSSQLNHNVSNNVAQSYNRCAVGEFQTI